MQSTSCIIQNTRIFFPTRNCLTIFKCIISKCSWAPCSGWEVNQLMYVMKWFKKYFSCKSIQLSNALWFKKGGSHGHKSVVVNLGKQLKTYPNLFSNDFLFIFRAWMWGKFTHCGKICITFEPLVGF